MRACGCILSQKNGVLNMLPAGEPPKSTGTPQESSEREATAGARAAERAARRAAAPHTTGCSTCSGCCTGSPPPCSCGWCRRGCQSQTCPAALSAGGDERGRLSSSPSPAKPTRPQSTRAQTPGARLHVIRYDSPDTVLSPVVEVVLCATSREQNSAATAQQRSAGTRSRRRRSPCAARTGPDAAWPSAPPSPSAAGPR